MGVMQFHHRSRVTVRHPCVSLVRMTNRDAGSSTVRKKYRLIKNKWFQWFVLLVMVSILLPYSEDNPFITVAFVYVILFPSFMFMGGTWKILRFNFFPSPVQLWKGFRRQWHAIEKGPVVVRVHRKKPSQSST